MRFSTMVSEGRNRPIIPLVLESAVGDRTLVDALVDTGADITIFSEAIAETLGIDLSGVPESPIRSPLGHAGTYRAIELTLELRRYPNILRWTGLVGFVPPRLQYALLGTRGFFEFFAVHYDSSQGFLEISKSRPISESPSL